MDVNGCALAGCLLLERKCAQDRTAVREEAAQALVDRSRSKYCPQWILSDISIMFGFNDVEQSDHKRHAKGIPP